MADFKKLHVWQKAHELNLRVSRTAARFRGAEYMSLRSQMVRAALSIPANIVEGRAQSSDAQFARFILIAVNSASELEYHLLTARDLGRLSEREHESVHHSVIEVKRMLYGLLAALEKSRADPRKR